LPAARAQPTRASVCRRRPWEGAARMAPTRSCPVGLPCRSGLIRRPPASRARPVAPATILGRPFGRRRGHDDLRRWESPDAGSEASRPSSSGPGQAGSGARPRAAARGRGDVDLPRDKDASPGTDAPCVGDHHVAYLAERVVGARVPLCDAFSMTSPWRPRPGRARHRYGARGRNPVSAPHDGALRLDVVPSLTAHAVSWAPSIASGAGARREQLPDNHDGNHFCPEPGADGGVRGAS